MANIAANNVTYVVKNTRRMGNSKVHNRVQLAFGNSTLTYPAGGIPLLPGSMGCPNVVESLCVTAQGTSGYVFSYNQATGNLIVKQGGASTSVALAEASTVAIAAQTIEAEIIGW